MSASLLDQLTTFLSYLNLPAKIDLVLAKQEATMAAIDDLKTALAQLSADIAAEITALQAALTTNNDAAIEDAVTNMKALSVQLESSLGPGPTPKAPTP